MFDAVYGNDDARAVRRMNKISSDWTFFYKKVFPVFWFGFLALFVAIGLGQASKDPMVLIVPLVMALFGFFLMKALVWGLVDEVVDGGTVLLVRKGDEEDSVPLANIMNVSATMNSRPPRVTLRLIRPGKFGSEVSFMPVTPFTLNPFAKNQVVEDLILRVHQARSKHA